MLSTLIALCCLFYFPEIFSCHTIKKTDRTMLTESTGFFFRNIDTMPLYITFQDQYRLKLFPNDEIFLSECFLKEKKIEQLSLLVQSKFKKMQNFSYILSNRFQFSQQNITKPTKSIKLQALYLTLLRKTEDFKGYSIRNVTTESAFVTLRDDANVKLVKKLRLDSKENLYISNKFFRGQQKEFLLLKLLISSNNRPSSESGNKKIQDISKIMSLSNNESNPLEFTKVTSLKKFPVYTTTLEIPKTFSDNHKIYNIICGLNYFETTDGEKIETKFECEKDLTYFFKNSLLHTERTDEPYTILQEHLEEINQLPELIYKPSENKDEEPEKLPELNHDLSKPSPLKDETDQSPKLKHALSDPDQSKTV